MLNNKMVTKRVWFLVLFLKIRIFCVKMPSAETQPINFRLWFSTFCQLLVFCAEMACVFVCVCVTFLQSGPLPVIAVLSFFICLGLSGHSARTRTHARAHTYTQ